MSLIGALLTADSGYPWGFYVFAVVAVLGLVCAAAVGCAGTRENPVEAAEARS